MTVIWIVAGIVVGQALIGVVLWRVMNTFRVYAESLLSTNQQNIDIRLRLAKQDSNIAYLAREILRGRKGDPPHTENIA